MSNKTASSRNELSVEPQGEVGQLPPASPRSMAKLFRTSKELVKAEVSKISGKIPSYIKGSYIRTGPGKFDFSPSSGYPAGFNVNHFMDGYAIITKFEIDQETVKYTKKFLETDAYKKAMLAQKPVICEYATQASPDPTKSRFSRFMPTSLLPELSDNSNINLFNVGDNICVTGETCYFRELDADTLQGGEKFDTNKMFGLSNATAHPLTDEDGNTYNIGSSMMTGLKYNLFKIPPGDPAKNVKDTMKKSRVIASIPSSNSGLLSYNHSFGMSKNYFVLIEQPFVLNFSKIVGALMSKGYSFSDWLEWRPEIKNRFHIIEKATGKVLKTEIWCEKPFFFLHVINCFEVNNQLVLDLTTFPDPNVLNALDLNKLRSGQVDNESESVAQRFIIPIVDVKDAPEGVNLVDLTNSTVKTEAKAMRDGDRILLTPDTMTEKGLELPAINRRFLSKKTSYFYATGSASKGFFENSLCKVHTTKKETFLFKESDTYYFGEPTFVPNPDGQTEDDGVLITAVTDIREESRDFLLFVDAKNMEELGRAEFENDIPQALHGIYVPTN